MRKYISLSFIGLLTILTSCDDVLEEDISDTLLTIISPEDKTSIEGNSVQFRWNSIEGAKNYRLQIMRNNQIILLDSLINETIFNYQINPGSYTWRIRGENFAYKTPYTFENLFTISESLDLTNQLITLNNPSDNLYTNNTDLSFSWQSISTADFYDFEILNSNNIIFQETDIVGSSINIPNNTISEDSKYTWQVKAKNATSSTVFFNRVFYIDTENPPAPTLQKPDDNQIFSSEQDITFSYTFTDTGAVKSNILSTIEISQDESFSKLFLSDTSDDDEIIISFNTTGKYYWRVKGKDITGNQGSNSDSRSFTIN